MKGEEQFRMRPGSFSEMRNQRILLLSVGAFIGLGIKFYVSRDFVSTLLESPAAGLIATGVVIAILVFAFSSALKKQKIVHESFVLTISDKEIRTEQRGMKTQRVRSEDIKEIVRKPNGSFIIKGNSLLNRVYVPKMVDNLDRVEARLRQFKPVTTK